MITLRRSAERGHADYGWLDTRYTFSFADYYDPDHMGFRALRVINDDRVAGGGGFPSHPHRDMEIVTYVLDGALQHRDSMGTGSIIRPHEVQRMSAGTGVVHSEFNASPDDPLRLLQIWILPEKRGLKPGYEQTTFPEAEKRGRLRLVASPDGAGGSVTIRQDVRLYASLLAPGESVTHRLAPGRHAWLQVARGAVRLNGTEMAEGDGAAVLDEEALTIEGTSPAEILLFDLN
jgi:hypothetical protein